jgi:hypothetical protein
MGRSHVCFVAQSGACETSNRPLTGNKPSFNAARRPSARQSAVAEEAGKHSRLISERTAELFVVPYRLGGIVALPVASLAVVALTPHNCILYRASNSRSAPSIENGIVARVSRRPTGDLRSAFLRSARIDFASTSWRRHLRTINPVQRGSATQDDRQFGSWTGPLVAMSLNR